jgi:hypothetical protein
MCVFAGGVRPRLRWALAGYIYLIQRDRVSHPIEARRTHHDLYIPGSR